MSLRGRVAWVAVGLSLVGCGSAPRETARPPSSGLTGSAVTVTSSGAEPSNVPSIAREPGAVPAIEDDADRLQRWEERLSQAVDAFHASPDDCRTLCRASSQICEASEAICRLTGDGPDVRPADPRCERAREACLDGRRRVTGACPVCPTT